MPTAAILTSVELALRIVLLAMESATPEQRAKVIAWWIEDVEKHRAFWQKLIDAVSNAGQG